jgi:hypothetical protein
MITVPLVLDLFVAILLLATMATCWRLDRRLSSLRSEKAQLADLMADFNQAAATADQGLKALKAAASDVGRDVETLVAKGQGLREDLGFLIERGEPLADRLSESMRGRPVGVAPPPSPAAAPAPAPAAAPASAATAPRAAAPRVAPVARTEPRPPAASVPVPEPRSEIERELLKALAALR